MNPKFHEWASQYGEFCQYRLFGQKFVLLSSERVANALLAKRGDIYSDRASSPALLLFANGIFPGFQHRTELWRKQRKMMGSVLSVAFNKKFEPSMDIESKYTLLNLLENPAGFYDHFRRYSFSVLTRSGFGLQTKSMNEEVVERVHRVQTFTRDCFRPDKYLCNVVPWVLRLPSWINNERGTIPAEQQDYIDWMLGMQRNLRAEICEGKAADSLAKYFVENQDEFGLSDLHGTAVFHNILGAGTRSPPHALLAVITSLLFAPEWHEKMQQEIDHVVGDKRLPEFSDLPDLPLVRAVLKEALRMRSLEVEISVPHKLREDDFFEGYFFPAGTSFQVSLRTLFTDPKMYPDAMAFNPGRWVEPSYPTYKEPLTAFPNFQGFATFGYGRRVCPGANLAERSLGIMLARMAWGFDVRKPVNPVTGTPIEVKIEYEKAMNPPPSPFPCDFIPRSEERSTLLRQIVQESRKNDPLAGKTK